MGRRMGKQSFRRRMGRGRRRSGIMSTSSGPLIVLVIVVVVSLAVLAALYFFVLPPVMKLIGVPFGKPEPTPIVTAPPPTPTPHVVETADLATLQKEIVLKQKYVSDPMFFGGEVYFSAGTDEAGGPKMNNLYKFNVVENAEEKIGDMGLENDDIFTPRVNDKWMVWLDFKRKGGGFIKGINRKGGAPFVIKRIYSGKPKITLVGDYVAWVERTGTSTDKLFAMDLNTREAVVLDVMKNSVFGLSDANAWGDELIWANLDPEQGGQEAGETGLHGAIYSIRLDGIGAKPHIFRTGTYVHDPITNGKAYAWIDSNHSGDANLYISIGEAKPKKVDSGVVGYGFGDNFLAYSKNESIYVYFWDSEKTTCIIPEREKAMFLGVSENMVLWYDITVRERDILKYAPIS